MTNLAFVNEITTKFEDCVGILQANQWYNFTFQMENKGHIEFRIIDNTSGELAGFINPHRDLLPNHYHYLFQSPVNGFIQCYINSNSPSIKNIVLTKKEEQ